MCKIVVCRSVMCVKMHVDTWKILADTDRFTKHTVHRMPGNILSEFLDLIECMYEKERRAVFFLRKIG